MRQRRKNTVDRKLVPLWKGAAHTLFWHAKPLKHFRRQAPQQEELLTEFQKAGWPDFLEVCSLPADLTRTKTHLQASIKNLNRSLKGALHFRLEASGSRICWQAI